MNQNSKFNSTVSTKLTTMQVTMGKARKLREYFEAGTRLVWYIEPKGRTARAYIGEHNWVEIGAGDSRVGGDVLPGFVLPLEKLFARAEGPRAE